MKNITQLTQAEKYYQVPLTQQTPTQGDNRSEEQKSNVGNLGTVEITNTQQTPIGYTLLPEQKVIQKQEINITQSTSLGQEIERIEQQMQPQVTKEIFFKLLEDTGEQFKTVAPELSNPEYPDTINLGKVLNKVLLLEDEKYSELKKSFISLIKNQQIKNSDISFNQEEDVVFKKTACEMLIYETIEREDVFDVETCIAFYEMLYTDKY